MFEMDFSGLTDYLDEVQKALAAVNGGLGEVKINDVNDQGDVDRALGELSGIIDRAFAPYVANPTVREIAEGMKASYKAQVLRQVGAKRAEAARARPHNDQRVNEGAEPAAAPDEVGGETCQ